MIKPVRVWNSIKTRITLATLGVFVLSLWALASFTGRALRQDLLRLLSEQQVSTVSLLAGQVNRELTERFEVLEAMSARITAPMMDHPRDLQALLEARILVQRHFNSGIFVTGMDGTAVASVPASLGRVGVNYLDRDYIVAALQEGKATLGRPVLGRVVNAPVFVLATPLRDGKGQVIGALAGVTDMGRPNFLDNFAAGSYGQSGFYLLETAKDRLVITGTDKRRIMQPLPPPGQNPLIDRHVQGFDETGITLSGLGVEVLASAKRIGVGDWFMVAALPTAEAFAPIRAMQRRMLVATLLLTLAAATLTWWMLKRQLSPLLDTANTLATLSSTDQPLAPLAIARPDEIGGLISAFNRLLEALKARGEALQESEARQRLLADNVVDVLWTMGLDGRFTYVTPSVEKLRGYTPAEVLNQSLTEALTPESARIALESQRTTLEALERGEPLPTFRRELEQRCKDGSTVWTEVTTTELVGPAGDLRGILGVTRDITDRKRAESELRNSEWRLKTLLENLPAGVVIHGPDTAVLFSNGTAQSLLGLSEDQLLGKTAMDPRWCFLREDGSILPLADFPVLQVLSGRPVQDMVVGVRRPDRTEPVWLIGNGYPTHTAQGQLETAVITFSDISSLKTAEADRTTLQTQLQQSQKMESLGILAGGVAHDMNNVLGAILGLASARIITEAEGSPNQQAYAVIIKAAERGGKLVKGLLSFARQSPAENHELDMNTILQEEVRLLEHTTLSKVSFVTDLAPDLRPIQGDASALTHAFMNLCVNAVDAMSERGTLTLRTRNVDHDWIEVVVEDTGTGMSKEVLERALDPFFTTKEVGMGTGLGLSTVYSTVKAHQGHMELQSQPGQGTAVTMRFPVSTGMSTGDRALTEAEIAPVKQSLNVLVVDDDELIQCAVQTLLEILGHTASIVACGEEALTRLETGFEPDVVIMDLNMPGLGGAGTLPRLRQLRPTLPVLLATGRVDQVALDLAAADPQVTLLSKPYSKEDLQRHLEALVRG